MLVAFDTSVLIAGVLAHHPFHTRAWFRVNPAGTALYTDALARCAAHTLKSGMVFDALHLLDAEQAGAEVFLTFNASDFARLSNGPTPKIVVPPDPPSLLLPR